MNKKIINLGIGIALAIVAVIAFQNLLQQTVEKYRQELLRKEEIPVVIAQVDIYKGTKITAHHIALARLPQNLVEQGAFFSVDSALDKVATSDILKGEQITNSKIFLPYRTGKFSQLTPEGYRAMTISVDKISSINGMIAPADKVDIIGLFPFPQGSSVVVPMYENVLILAVESRTSDMPSVSSEMPSTITLALTPEQASLLTFAMEMGRIKLLLRSPLDQGLTSKEFVTVDKLWEKLLNIKKTAPPPPPEPPTVEVFKGTEKTSINLEGK